MPVRNLTPEDEQPLARSVAADQLARTVGTEQEEEEARGAAAEQEEETPHAEEQQEAPQQETEERDKGRLEKVLDKAQENGWVYPSVANKAREMGLVSKADEAIDKAVGGLSGSR